MHKAYIYSKRFFTKLWSPIVKPEVKLSKAFVVFIMAPADPALPEPKWF